MNKLLLSIFLPLLIGFLSCQHRQQTPTQEKDRPYNVLLITIDDLRPQFGCYGDPMAITPNIDRLASQSLLFERAYCQTALCGPSRTSFLSGYYPGTLGGLNNQTHLRDVRPNAVTLPQLFKKNGYTTTGLFKIFHLAGFDPNLFENNNDTASWTIPHWTPSRSCWGPHGDSIYQVNKKVCLARGPINYSNIPRSLAYEAPEIADSLLSDGETAQRALRYLRAFRNEPFFLAVGFYNPHLPFVAPKKYWDLYDKNDMALPDNQHAPEGVPTSLLPSDKELRSYVNIPDQAPFTETLKKELLHGYLAAISYVDAQVGLLLEELQNLGLKDNTIVILLGDHGYQIGEHNLWCKKHTNFESATRVPLLISTPNGMAAGKRTDALVELVDLYPTLAELCNLEPPADLDGTSLTPLLKNPKLHWSETAYSRYGQYGNQRSIRTEHFRLNRRKRADAPFFELYDHRRDPEENHNLAVLPEYEYLVDSLNSMMDVLHLNH